MALSITWLGHATFVLQSPGGKRIILDPWVTGNPSSPESAKKLGALDLMLITHGHADHTGDAVSIGRSSGAHVVAPYEVSVWLQQKGLKTVTGMNPGGTLELLGLSITMVPAMHSSSIEEDGKIIYLGVATGYVIRFEDGLTIYYSGDTSVFGDMRLIGEMYSPSIAFLPIGDLYTMGPAQAAKACELLGINQTSRFSRLATTTRWDLPRRRSRHACWECARWCRCTTARSPRSPARRPGCANWSPREAYRCSSSNPGKQRLKCNHEEHEDTKHARKRSILFSYENDPIFFVSPSYLRVFVVAFVL
jgi:L-ascorbate metabolism protein UlaG (beta-lactamase superfamily)